MTHSVRAHAAETPSAMPKQLRPAVQGAVVTSIFGLVLQGPLRSAVGRGKYGARLTVCGGCGHRLAGLFVLIRGYWQGVFRSTPIRLWCYEPVD